MIPLLYFTYWLQDVDLCDQFFLSNKIAWNLPGFTIILLFLNQSITILGPDCKTSIDSKTVLAKTDNVLSSVKL